jgi:hypothetical protein
LVLTLHFQGQTTCERVAAVLTAAGVAISKRQVVRLLTAKLDLFRAEDEAVFTVGRVTSASTTPARATPGEPATRPNSALIGSPPSAPGRADSRARSPARGRTGGARLSAIPRAIDPRAKSLGSLFGIVVEFRLRRVDFIGLHLVQELRPGGRFA